MKVKDLLEHLKGLDPEASVIIQMQSGCCGDSETMEIIHIDVCPDPIQALFIELKPLPGYKSCIQVGSTKRKDEEYWKDDK